MDQSELDRSPPLPNHLRQGRTYLSRNALGMLARSVVIRGFSPVTQDTLCFEQSRAI